MKTSNDKNCTHYSQKMHLSKICKNKHIILEFSQKQLLRRIELVALILPLKKKEKITEKFKIRNNESIAIVLPFIEER